MKGRTQDGKLKMIAWITTAILVLFGIIGNGPSTYRFAVIFLAPMLWAIYYFRERLALTPLGYAIFASALILHDLGAFGFYRKTIAGIEFDFYVHFYFGVAGAFLLTNALHAKFGWKGVGLLIGVVLGILGIGAIHELIEFASTLILGPEKGMLKINDPDKYDTHKDLLNNLMGALVGFAWFQISSRRRPGELQRA
jgi:uncharacterized membrane protein YjdF